MAKDETQKAIQQGQINLLIHFGKNSLHQNIAFAFASFPDIGQIIDALSPLREKSIDLKAL